MALTKVRVGVIEDAPVGIHSGGTLIHSASTDLNFVGTGHTFTVNGGTTNISLAGGGGYDRRKTNQSLDLSNNLLLPLVFRGLKTTPGFQNPLFCIPIIKA